MNQMYPAQTSPDFAHQAGIVPGYATHYVDGTLHGNGWRQLQFRPQSYAHGMADSNGETLP